MRLSETDHARVTAAVTAAEAHTDGEIVTVVAGRSDAYHDVALHWSVLAMLFALALLAWMPAPVEWLHARLIDAWSDTPPRWYLTFALVLIALVFLAARVLLAKDALRMALTPGAGLAQAQAQAQDRARTPTLTIHADQVQARVSPDLYGLMTEEINFSYEGGLYGELIRNRSFKADPSAPAWWDAVGDAKLSLDTAAPLNAALDLSLKLDAGGASKARPAGIANGGYWGVPVRLTEGGADRLPLVLAGMDEGQAQTP